MYIFSHACTEENAATTKRRRDNAVRVSRSELIAAGLVDELSQLNKALGRLPEAFYRSVNCYFVEVGAIDYVFTYNPQSAHAGQ